MLNLSLWKIKGFRELGKKMLVALLMRSSKKTGFSVTREISHADEPPVVKDTLTPNTEDRALITQKKYSAIHMASSKYFFEQS